MHIHTRCPIDGFDIDIQRHQTNVFEGEPEADALEDRHDWIEVMYVGGNPFLQIPPKSWLYLILYAKAAGVVAMQNPDADFRTFILNPGNELRATVVSERIRKNDFPPGINLALLFRSQENQKLFMWRNTLQAYGVG